MFYALKAKNTKDKWIFWGLMILYIKDFDLKRWFSFKYLSIWLGDLEGSPHSAVSNLARLYYNSP